MMYRMATPTPPKDEGSWTLLQQRLDRALWQWDRPTIKNHANITRFVITHDPSRLDFDDFDEAETVFEMIED